MARIVVYAMANRGDVFPYVPIASELSRRGHDVTFVGPEELRAQLAPEPFAFRDGDCGDLTPARLDAHADYVRRWGRVLSGGMLLRLYFGELVVTPRSSAGCGVCSTASTRRRRVTTGSRAASPSTLVGFRNSRMACGVPGARCALPSQMTRLTGAGRRMRAGRNGSRN